MLRLSSGRTVDLVTDRAKMHALKHSGIDADAAHRALYKLVDVIYRHSDEQGHPLTGWTEFDFIFSGYTLADIHAAADWTTQEKQELYSWASLKSQQLLIETCRRRLSDKQARLSCRAYTAPEQLYSTLINRIQNLPQEKASVEQWLATIRNLEGIRKEEIEWSKLYPQLRKFSATEKLSKQSLLELIDFNYIRLQLSAEKIHTRSGSLCFQEVAQRMPHQEVYRAALQLDNRCQCILRYVDEVNNYRVGVVKTLDSDHSMVLNRFWFALDPYGRAIKNKTDQSLFFPTNEMAKSAANRHARTNFAVRYGTRFNTHFDHLTLFGGDNYREWLITLPDFQRTFFGAHFNDHNILAHVRTTTRTDRYGRRLLFIEEVQSDWHQNGQRYGYNNSYWGKVSNAPYKKEWVSLATKLMLIHASQNGFDGIAWPDGSIQETRYTRNLSAIKRHYDKEIPETLNRLGKFFNSSVQQTSIRSRDPWLNIIKKGKRWKVSDGTGKFETREKYNSRDEAMMVLHCHCKTIDLPVSVFLISDDLRLQIASKGLPMFGHHY